MTQYEVWEALLPEPAGARPVMLLTRASAYAYLNRILVVEITTTIRGIPQELTLGRKEGLAKRCVANFDNVHAVAKTRLRRRLGGLTRSRVHEVKTAMGAALGWPELVADD